MSKIDHEALEWVARQETRELDDAERAAFDAWFHANPRHQGAYLRASAIQHSLSNATVQESQRPGAEQLQQQRDWEAAAVPPPLRNRRAFLYSGALAAGLAAVAAFVFIPKAQDRTVLQTARAEIRRVPLADNSIVSINSASLVEVSLSQTERRLYLKQGEAWFDVAKDKAKPFIVEAGDVRVRAVGTAFGVKRFDNGAEVSVSEGVVEVWSDDGKALRRKVLAGEQAFVPTQASDIRVLRDPDAVQRKLAWRDGKLILQNDALSDAVADFNRHNARQIVIADAALRGKRVVGQYRLDQPEQFADDVRLLLKVPVEITPERIKIGAGSAGK